MIVKWSLRSYTVGEQMALRSNKDVNLVTAGASPTCGEFQGTASHWWAKLLHHDKAVFVEGPFQNCNYPNAYKETSGGGGEAM
jgi:hypothetical protein